MTPECQAAASRIRRYVLSERALRRQARTLEEFIARSGHVRERGGRHVSTTEAPAALWARLIDESGLERIPDATP